MHRAKLRLVFCVVALLTLAIHITPTDRMVFLFGEEAHAMWPVDGALNHTEVEVAQRYLAMANRPGAKPGPDSSRTWTEPATGMEFVWIPKGCFRMGSSWNEEGQRPDETPAHSVCVDGFWMGKYEVTQGQWRKVMGGNPSFFAGDDSFPVEKVTWEKAKEFAGELSLSNNGQIRLPTEAEWEYACRAGTSTPFSFGEMIVVDQANYDGDFVYGNGREGEYRRKTMPVGSLPPNAFGLHDMHGNVWEWCEDVYESDFYGRSPKSNPVNTAQGERRVLRGGSWYSYPWDLRSASRGRLRKDFRAMSIGFRLVRAASDPAK